MIRGQEGPKPSKFVPTGSGMVPNLHTDAHISKRWFTDESFERKLGSNEVTGTDSHSGISGFAGTERKLGMMAHALYLRTLGDGAEVSMQLPSSFGLQFESCIKKGKEKEEEKLSTPCGQ